MHTSLGTLNFIPASEHPELLAKVAKEVLSTLTGSSDVGVAEIDPNLSDTATFCEHYKIEMKQAANCVVLEAKRGGKSSFVACVILGNTRADINGLVRRILDARKVSFAPMEQAVAQTSMEYGAITPVGLPKDWPIMIDKAVAGSNHVIIGSGIRGSKLVVSGSFLASLPNASVIEDLAQPRV